MTRPSLLAVLVTDSDESREMTALRSERLDEALAAHPGPFGSTQTRTVPRADLAASAWPSDGWIFVLMPGDVPVPRVCENVAIALDAYDAVWGASLHQDAETKALVPVPNTRLGCTTLGRLLYRAPGAWLGGSFFIRAARARTPVSPPWHGIDALLEVWHAERATKLSLPFVARMEVGSDAPIWAEVLRHFRSRPAIERIPVEDETLNFRIAYWNPITERRYLRSPPRPATS